MMLIAPLGSRERNENLWPEVLLAAPLALLSSAATCQHFPHYLHLLSRERFRNPPDCC